MRQWPEIGFTASKKAGSILTIDDFIARWSASGGSERANFQQFAIELTQILEVPAPKPATADAQNDDYRFERPVTFIHTGTQSRGFITFTGADASSWRPSRARARHRMKSSTCWAASRPCSGPPEAVARFLMRALEAHIRAYRNGRDLTATLRFFRTAGQKRRLHRRGGPAGQPARGQMADRRRGL